MAEEVRWEWGRADFPDYFSHRVFAWVGSLHAGVAVSSALLTEGLFPIRRWWGSTISGDIHSLWMFYLLDLTGKCDSPLPFLLYKAPRI